MATRSLPSIIAINYMKKIKCLFCGEKMEAKEKKKNYHICPPTLKQLTNNKKCMKKFYCPKCGGEISTKMEDITTDYFGACMSCDEDFYKFELLTAERQATKEQNAPYKRPCEVMYHVFSNGADEYEENIDKVFSILEKWYKDGKRDIRVYKQTECNEDKGIFSEGDCIFSIGAWPM